MSRFVLLIASMLSFLAAESLDASQVSTGPMGINSIGTGLTGMGVAIGQVEPDLTPIYAPV